MVDANFNRCSEGLRVLEDWCRFVADDVALSRQVKNQRHHLHQISQAWPLSERLAGRDSVNDVGRSVATVSEYERPDEISLLQANFYRVQQSLRVLEESCKRLGFPATELEQMRYQSYQVQKDALAMVYHKLMPQNLASTAEEIGKDPARRQALLRRAQLYALTSVLSSESDFLQHLQRLCDGGVDVIQLRAKAADDRTLLARATLASQHLQNTTTLFIVNDRADIAIASGADGVHVGQEELPVSAVRSLVGPQRLIGLSTHSVQQIEQAQHSAADYLGVGPVFPSQTKSFSQHLGVDFLQQVKDKIEIPAFAIGGIDEANLPSVVLAGFQRIVVGQALGCDEKSTEKAQRLKQMLPSSAGGCG